MGWKEKIEKAAALVKQARDILKEYEGKELPADKAAEVDKLFDDAEKLKAEADRMKKAEELDKELNEPEKKDEHKHDTKPGGAPDDEKAQKEVTIKAYKRFLHYGVARLEPEDIKQLSSLRDPEGGYVVPEEYRMQFIQKLADAVYIRQRATVLTTSAGSVGFPTFDYEGDAEWTAESGKIAEETFTNLLGKKRFVPSKLARIFRVPVELSEDAAVNIDQLLLDHFAKRFGIIEENNFINGDGVEKPYGLLNTPGMGEETIPAGTGDGQWGDDQAVADALIGVIYAIKAQYRSRGAWLLNRQMVKRARTLKDTNGQYLWQLGLQAGQPNTLLAYPVMESEFFPFGTDAGSINAMFGDYSYYWIIDRTDLAIQRLIEKYAEYDQVGYKLRKRTDAAPVLGEPFAVLKIVTA